MCVCVCVRVRVCARACVRACVRVLCGVCEYVGMCVSRAYMYVGKQLYALICAAFFNTKIHIFVVTRDL